MMEKLKLFFQLFRKGSELAHADLWKQRQITGTMLGALILIVVNIAGAFGYVLPVDTETANAIGTGIISVTNVVLTMLTSKRAGVGTGPEPTSADVQPTVIKPTDVVPTLTNDQVAEANEYAKSARDTGIF